MHLLGSISLDPLRLFVTLASLEVRGSSRPRVRFVRGVVTYDFGINITAVINVVRFLAGTASFDGVDVVDTIDEGFRLEDSEAVHVDSIEHDVKFKEASVESLLGKTVRLYFMVQDADLYGFRFK